MDIHEERLSDVERYIQKHVAVSLNRYGDEFNEIMAWVTKIKQIRQGMDFLEVGPGMGWFQLMAYNQYGLTCHGIEISKDLLDFANKFLKEHGVETNLFIGNIEATSLLSEKYDFVLATQVFEHVERYRDGLENIFQALKPGGAFFFASNNKWAFHTKSGEYNFPFYDQLPNWVRYRIRIRAQGEDIMKHGIDFNTFTYPQLRKLFREIGFSKIYDKIDLREPSELGSPIKRRILLLAKSNPTLKRFIEPFVPGTRFVCIK